VHHDTIKLVSLNFRFRRRIAVVLRTSHRYREFAARASLTRMSSRAGDGKETGHAEMPAWPAQEGELNLADQCPKKVPMHKATAKKTAAIKKNLLGFIWVKALPKADWADKH
jgi:hypothetical protein